MSTNTRRTRRVAKSKFIHQYGTKIRSDVKRIVDSNNAQCLPERRVSFASAIKVVNRSLNRSRNSNPHARIFSALREVSAFVSLAAHDRRTTLSMQHADLLPVAHPASTKSHSMSAASLRHARARWIAADPMISDSARPLVVSAYSAEPGSPSRLHAFTRLSALTASAIPRYLLIDAASDPVALVAVGGFGLGGNSRAARSLRARLQRRDRRGRFAFMGGGFSFNINLGGKTFSASGRVVGASGENDIEIEVVGNPDLPNGIYAIPSSKGLSSKAVISREALREIPEVQLDKATGGRESIVEESELRRLDAPTGWNRVDSGDDNFEQFVSDDGYFARKNLETDEYTLHRADLTDNSVGEEVGSGDSWADVQKAAKKDAPEYEKVLQEADAAEKSKAPSRASDADAQYDRIKDELLEEGYSPGSPGYQEEMERRAADVDDRTPAPFTPSTSKTRTTAAGRGGNSRKLLAWASEQDDDKLKSISSQRGQGLTEKQWNALERSAAKDPDFDSFVDLPSGMSQDEADALTEWAENVGDNRSYRAFNRSLDPNKPDIEVFDSSSDASEVDVENFLRESADGFVSESSWRAIKIAKAMADTKDPSDVRARAVVERSISTPEERDMAAGKLLDRTDELIDRIDDMPDSPYRDFLESKARNQIEAAREIADGDDLMERADATAEDLSDGPDGDGPDEVPPAPPAPDEPNDVAGDEEPDEVPPAPPAPDEPEDYSGEDEDIFAEVGESVASEATDFSPGADVDDARNMVEGVIEQGGTLRFDYNGRERLFRPTGVWENQQNGNINMVGEDVATGDSKTYTIQKMEAPEPLPAPGSGEPEDVTDTEFFALRSLIDDAVASNGKLRFKYNDTERVFSPTRVYTNPKTGNTNVVGFDETNGEERTYTIEKIQPAKDAGSPLGIDPINEELFDEMFEVPEGAYKPNIFDFYQPRGRTDESSTDYTDDPDELSTRFTQEELVIALRQAVMPDDATGDPATGFGMLEFDDGEESVPAEALYEAIQRSGAVSPDIALGAIYDQGFADDTGRVSNVQKLREISGELFESMESPARTQVPTSQDDADSVSSPRSSQGGIVRAQRAVQLMRDHDEQNQKLAELADELNGYGTNDVAPVSLDEAFERYYPLAISDDPEDREAFRAFWGVIMSLSGGDIDLDERSATDSSFSAASRMVRIIENYNPDNPVDDFFAMVATYGDYPDFINGKERISSGVDDLSSDSTAAAFYRLIAAGSTPNEKPLYRVMNFTPGDPEYSQVTTEGSIIDIDARPFTEANLVDGTAGAGIFYREGKARRVVIEAEPGVINAMDVSNTSPFPEEEERVGYGRFEVVSVRREPSGLGDEMQDVVTIRPVQDDDAEMPEAPEAAPSPPPPPPPPGGRVQEVIEEFSTPITGIENWERTGAQAGSNAGGFYRDPDGNEYYVKSARSQSHADNESLASAFYQILGVPAAKMLQGDEGGELRIVSPLVPDADTRDFEFRVSNDDEEYLAKVRDGFVIDAWLANWDSVGLVYDNIVTDGDGNPVRVDPGGSLMYRARGASKVGAFGNTVGEIDTLRDPDMNYEAASVFGPMSDADLRASAMRLREITPSQIDEVIDSIVVDPDDRALLKERLKARRQDLMDRFNIPEGADDPELYPDPIPLTEAMGYQAQDLQPGDITAGDSFVVEKVFYDEDTPKGKVSIQGYFPGHESQRKEWNPETEIEVSRGGTIPPKGDKPALHRPKRPRSPRTQETFTGDMQDLVSGAESWGEVAEIIRGTEIVYFDYETTGIGDGELNRPVQIGAVRVVDGEVVERFNMYMNPEFRLSDWSKENLKREDGELVTDEWLETQPSMREVHEQFLEFVGDRPILGGQNVPFDTEVLQRTLSEQGLELEIAGTIDSLPLARGTLPKWNSKELDGPMAVGRDGKRRSSYSLGPVAEYLGVELGNWHRADADAEAAWDITNAMLDRAVDPDIDTPTDPFDGTERDKAALERAEYEAEMSVYAEELADYEAAKAVAAAWNCGGAGITAAVGNDEGPCDTPDPDDMINNATPKPDSVDRDGTAVGPTDGSSSLEEANDPEVERPEKDGINVKDPYADEQFPPTDQQRDVVDAVLTGENVVVRALAGTGKTSTLKLIARRLKRDKPGERIAYVAFNKSIQLEADATMPDNVESRTGDSIAWRAVDDSLKAKRNKNKFNNKPSDQADKFGITGQPNPDDAEDSMSKVQVVRAIQKAINNYTVSADDEIGPQHFEFDNVPDEWISKANEMWSDINSADGWLPFTNNHATKIWALTRPDLSKPGSGLNKPASVIFFDEAQDINPVMGKVIADQDIQVIYVGDGNQAIYAFRGAVDELQNVDAPHDLPLTKSWRFGPEVAGIGNRFLSLLDSPHRIEGGGPSGEIVPSGSMTDADAVLVRTNAGAFKEIFRELGNDRKVAVTKAHKDDLTKFADHAAWLINGADPSDRPSMHEDLAQYKSWDEVLKEIGDEDSDASRKLKALVELVEESGIAEFKDVLNQLIAYNASSDLDMSRVESADVASGMRGSIVSGLDFYVEGDTIVLSGSETYNLKDKHIKPAGFKWDKNSKSWRKAVPGDQARADEINKLRNSIAERPDVVITTAHRSKGLEWDRVRIGDDFWGPKIDKETGESILPSAEELRLDYVAVTRAKSQLDPGGLDWIYGETSEADEAPRVDAPEADTTPDELPAPQAEDAVETPETPDVDETPEPAPEPLPDPGSVSGQSAAPDDLEDTKSLATPKTEPAEQETPEGVSVQPVEFDPSSQASFDDDIDDSIDDVDSSIEEAKFVGSAKTSPDAKKLIRSAKDAKKALEDYRDGKISHSELVEKLKSAEADAEAIKMQGPNKIIADFVKNSIVDARRIADGTAYGPASFGKGLPPEGSGLGFDKDGVFIKPGMRVRDKWGYAGTVVRYNDSGGFVNVYIRKDIDHRDPDKVNSSKKAQKFGPGFIDSKGTKTLTVIKDGDDNSPYVPVIDKNGTEKKAPADFENQLAEYQKISDNDDGEGPVGLDKTPEPSDDDSGGEADAGTTEALRENVEERAEERAAEEAAPSADPREAEQRITEALRDSENPDYSANDPTIVDLLAEELAQTDENDQFITIKPPGGFETTIRRSDAVAIVNRAGGSPKAEAPSGAPEAPEASETSTQYKSPEADSYEIVSDAYESADFTYKTSNLPTEGLIDYITWGTEDINGLLTAIADGYDDEWLPDEGEPETIAEYVEEIDNTIEAAPTLDRDIVVYRGTVGRKSRLPQIGDVVTGPRYMSTSMSSAVAEDFARIDRHFTKYEIDKGIADGVSRIVYEIQVPEGENILSVSHYLPGIDTRLAQDPENATKDWVIEGLDGQQEILLRRGADVKILDISERADGVVVIKAAMLSKPKKELEQVPKAEAPEGAPNNSEENMAKLGTTISVPNVLDENISAAPDHTPDDEELYNLLVGEGPNATGSPLTESWVAHLDEYRSSGTVDDEVLEALELFEKGDSEELFNATEDNAFLQNLRYAIIMWTSKGPQDTVGLSEEWDRSARVGAEDYTYTDLIPDSRFGYRSFYTDLARYYNDPSLIDSEMTPASAFLRALRSAKVKDGMVYERYLIFEGFDSLDDVDHPLRDLGVVGQMFDLRPSSWTVADNEDGMAEFISPWLQDPDAFDYDPDGSSGHVILRIEGGEAIDISGLSSMPEERESVLTNGRYRVVSVEHESRYMGPSGNVFDAKVITLEKVSDAGNDDDDWDDDEPGISSEQAELNNLDETVSVLDDHPRPMVNDLVIAMSEENPYVEGSPHWAVWADEMTAIARALPAYEDEQGEIRAIIAAGDPRQIMARVKEELIASPPEGRYADKDWLLEHGGDPADWPMSSFMSPETMEFEGVELTMSYADNVWVANPYTAGRITSGLRSGKLTPPVLPLYIPMDFDGSGEGYYFSKSGNRYWGRFGAAGALVSYVDENGDRRYVLGRRAQWISAGGGKWAIPGGAHTSEKNSVTPGTTAAIELAEELGISLNGATPSYTHINDVEPDWKYSTEVYDVDESLARSAKISDSETDEIGFFTADEIMELVQNEEVHPALLETFEEIIQRFENSIAAKEIDDIDYISSLDDYTISSQEDYAEILASAGISKSEMRMGRRLTDSPFYHTGAPYSAEPGSDQVMGAKSEASLLNRVRDTTLLDAQNYVLNGPFPVYTASGLFNESSANVDTVLSHIASGRLDIAAMIAYTLLNGIQIGSELAKSNSDAVDRANIERQIMSQIVDALANGDIDKVRDIFNTQGYLTESFLEQLEDYGMLGSDVDYKHMSAARSAILAGLDRLEGSVTGLSLARQLFREDPTAVVYSTPIIRVGPGRKIDSQGIRRLSLSETDFEEVPSMMETIEQVHSTSGQPVLSTMFDGDSIEDGEVSVISLEKQNEPGETKTELRFTLTAWAAENLDRQASSDIATGSSRWERVKSDLPEYYPSYGNYPGTTVDAKGYFPRRRYREVDPETGRVYIVEIEDEVAGRGIEYTSGADYYLDTTLHELTYRGDGFTVQVVRGDGGVEYLQTGSGYPRSLAATSYNHLPSDLQAIRAHNAQTDINSVSVIFDSPDPDEATILEAMKIAGVADPRPATKEDLDLLIENRYLSLKTENSKAASPVASSAVRKAEIDRIEAESGASLKDYTVRRNPLTGRAEILMSDELANYLASEYYYKAHLRSDGMYKLWHSGTMGVSSKKTTSEFIFSAFFSDQREMPGGLHSTVSRLRSGVEVRGQSSASDFASGAADYVYLSKIKPSFVGRSGDERESSFAIRFNPDYMLKRLDFWANEDDEFGARASTSIRPLEHLSSSGAYEIMYKGSVGLEGVEAIYLAKREREKLISMLENSGVSEVNGVPIDEFIREHRSG